MTAFVENSLIRQLFYNFTALVTGEIYVDCIYLLQIQTIFLCLHQHNLL